MMGFGIKKSTGTDNHGARINSIELLIDPNIIDIELEAMQKAGLINDPKDLLNVFGGISTLPQQTIPSTTPSSTVAPQNSTLLLSELIDRYCKDKVDNNSWNESTLKKNLQKINVLKFIIGDCSVQSIDRDATRSVRDSLKKYPKDKNKKAIFNSLTMQQIEEMNISDVIANNNVRGYLVIFGGMFIWAKREGYIENNPFENITVQKESIKREPFSSKDLNNIFSSPIFTKNEFEKPFQYWTPLIALHTGARRSEIAQLELKDFKKIQNTWVIDINTDTSVPLHKKSVKNTQSIRRVPIHSKLIELDLLNYVEELKMKDKTRLFPELIAWDVQNGYGRAISDWFNLKYLKSLDIDANKNVFHSFRSNLVHKLSNSSVGDENIQQIIGHKAQTTMRKHYLKESNPKILHEHLEKADFDDCLSDVKPFRWS